MRSLMPHIVKILPTNPLKTNNENKRTKTQTTTRETTTLMEIIKQKQKRKQQQQQSEKKKTTKTTTKQQVAVTKTQQVDPNTESGSLKKNDIRLYLAKNLGKTEAAALPLTIQLVFPPSPPPTTREPTTPQLTANPSKDGDSASCVNTTQRGILKSERQTKPNDAARGDTGCDKKRQSLQLAQH